MSHHARGAQARRRALVPLNHCPPETRSHQHTAGDKSVRRTEAARLASESTPVPQISSKTGAPNADRLPDQTGIAGMIVEGRMISS